MAAPTRRSTPPPPPRRSTPDRPDRPDRPGRGGRPLAPADRPERLPRWLPPAVYALMALLLFREFIFGGANLLGMDTLALAYFARDFYTGFVRHFHQFPLWDPYLYGGLPFVEATHGDIFYPPSLALFFLSATAMWGWKIILHVFLAGIFGYMWLREIGARRTSAFLGGLVYMMGAEIVSLVYPGADAKIFVSALAPLAFWLTERALARRGIADFAWLALGIALLMFTSHLQLVYFLVWGISLYAFFRLWQLWRESRSAGLVARLLGMFALAGILGVGASAVQLLPPYDYLKTYSRRTETTLKAKGPEAYAYSTSWSMHPEEVMSLLVPDFVGDNAPTEVKSGATYWGRNALKFNLEYAGIVLLLLAPLVFLRRRRPRDWFFLGLGVLSLLYAVGATTPLFHLFYLIPGVKLFRAPSLIIFLYAISLVTLGTFGFERYLDWGRGGDAGDRRAARLYLWGAAGVMVLLALLAQSGALLSLWQSVVYTGMTPDRVQAFEGNLPALQAGFWIAAFLAVVLAGAWEAIAAGVMGWRGALATVVVLGALDLYRVDRPFIRATELVDGAPEFATVFQPNDVVRFLQGRQAAGEVFRVLDLGPLLPGVGGNNLNWLPLWGIEQLAGHHPNELGRYRDLIGGEMPANLFSSKMRLLDLTNTVYLVAPQPAQVPGYAVAFQGAGVTVYRNPTALPRAFLVGQVEVVPDSGAVEHILMGPFDFSRVAALPAPLPAGVAIQPDPKGQVTWTTRGANELALSVTTDRPALLVVTDNYFNAWHAEVDGRPTPILRADYTFRAIPLGTGTHRVRMYYQSGVVSRSATASSVLLALLALVAMGGTLLQRRRGAAGASGGEGTPAPGGKSGDTSA